MATSIYSDVFDFAVYAHNLSDAAAHEIAYEISNRRGAHLMTWREVETAVAECLAN